MNIFSLHGKWYENNENRLTSNILFFLDEFRESLLGPFLEKFVPGIRLSKKDLAGCRIKFQAYDSGKYPDAEIILRDDTRILIESKVGANRIGKEQIREYTRRLAASAHQYPSYALLVITQTDQTAHVHGLANSIESEDGVPALSVRYCQWRTVIELFELSAEQSKDRVLQRLLSMFLEELQHSMYNRIDVDALPLGSVCEVVLTSQNSAFLDMALHHGVFWPKNNFSASQFVAYYFTDDCPAHCKTISHIARIRHIWHNVTIDEVVTAIPQFKHLPHYDKFEELALKVYKRGSPDQFPIALTDLPVELPRPIPYRHELDLSMNPRIIPGRHTTLAKLLTAKSLIDLK